MDTSIQTGTISVMIDYNYWILCFCSRRCLCWYQWYVWSFLVDHPCPPESTEWDCLSVHYWMESWDKIGSIFGCVLGSVVCKCRILCNCLDNHVDRLKECWMTYCLTSSEGVLVYQKALWWYLDIIKCNSLLKNLNTIWMNYINTWTQMIYSSILMKNCRS